MAAPQPETEQRIGLALLKGDAGMGGDEQAVKVLKEWMAERFQTIENRLDRQLHQEIARQDTLRGMGERLAVLENTISGNGGLVASETCRLRENGVTARLTALEDRVDKGLGTMSRRLWGFTAAIFLVVIGGFITHFITG